MRLAICLALLAGLVAAPSVADACGMPKPKQNYCYPPKPTPVPPTAVPTPPLPTVVPTPVPVPPSAPPPTQQPAFVPIAQPAVVSGGGWSPVAEWCHYEPTTNQWEIRHRAMQPGDRSPIEKGLCAQDRELAPTPAPTPVPVAVVVESPAPPAIVVEEIPPVVVEMPTPPPIEEVMPPMDETPPAEEESPPCVVPIQIPDWTC